MLTGQVDVAGRAGVVTQTVFAGGPSAMSAVALPGLSRIVRVTDVDQVGETLHLTGVVDDRAQLQPGEDPTVEIRIAPARGVVSAPFLGSPTHLGLVG